MTSRCIECEAPLEGAVGVGRCASCRIAMLPEGLRDVLEDEALRSTRTTRSAKDSSMPIDRRTADHVARAIVKLPRLGGLGVLVPGELIVTAAHCIEWTTTGAMVLGDRFHQDISTADGSQLEVQVLAVEPVSDVAILGAVDNQEFGDAAEAFEDFCARTAPVPVATKELELFAPIPAFVFTHRGAILPARVTQCAAFSANLFIETDEPIECGTSGGPVVTERGALLGIVSHSGGVAGEQAMLPRVHLSVPVWVAQRMGDAVGEKRCLLCGCPERLHAPLAPWCAGCGAPCPPQEAAQQEAAAEPPHEPRDAILRALEAYARRHR